MDITVLPQDLKIKHSQSIQIFDYKTEYGIHRNKINLAKNTISFLRMGIKEVIGNDESVQINNQSFVVMKAGNCLMTEKVSNANKVYQSILLFFSNDTAIDFLERNKLYTNSKKENNSFYIFKYDNFIEHFVQSLQQVLTLPQVTQEKILKAKFEEIMFYLIHQHGPSFLNSIIQQTDDSVIRLTNIVTNNRYKKLSLQELAFLSNMSVSTFKREFFKHYQKTPIKWFNEERLAHIALLLKTKQKRPIELFEEAGFENFSNFVQAFKKKFGVTPKQYQMKG